MIYLASKTKHAHMWRDLRAAGWPVISTWIDEAGPGESSDLSDLWVRCVAESSSAHCTLVYAEAGDVLKGAYIEMGCALAVGKPVLTVGLAPGLSVLNHPLVRVFHSLPEALQAAWKILEQAK